MFVLCLNSLCAFVSVVGLYLTIYPALPLYSPRFSFCCNLMFLHFIDIFHFLVTYYLLCDVWYFPRYSILLTITLSDLRISKISNPDCV